MSERIPERRRRARWQRRGRGATAWRTCKYAGVKYDGRWAPASARGRRWTQPRIWLPMRPANYAVRTAVGESVGLADSPRPAPAAAPAKTRECEIPPTYAPNTAARDSAC